LGREKIAPLKYTLKGENTMGMRSLSGEVLIEARPKKTRQGRGKHTKYAATSRNKAKKIYRGQGR
tara:strand:- start:20847 stop:21041 length:195 start_codon:yes stop_codon:yes gene_type:complete